MNKEKQILAIFVFLAVFSVNMVLAAVSCGDTINISTVLDSDLECAVNGLVMGVDNTVLDCNGHLIRAWIH